MFVCKSRVLLHFLSQTTCTQFRSPSPIGTPPKFTVTSHCVSSPLRQVRLPPQFPSSSLARRPRLAPPAAPLPPQRPPPARPPRPRSASLTARQRPSDSACARRRPSGRRHSRRRHASSHSSCSASFGQVSASTPATALPAKVGIAPPRCAHTRL